MSQWRCKIDGAEVGPVSFQELAGMVRGGKVTEGVLVRREGAASWEPAWHVPGLFRAAGIVEAGDSPTHAFGADTTQSVHDAQHGVAELPGYVARERRQSLLTVADLLRGTIAAAVGFLVVGFFYRWADQTKMAFPEPPTVIGGELIDCYFPIIGRCTSLECGLLYADAFVFAAAATWCAVRRNLTENWGPEE